MWPITTNNEARHHSVDKHICGTLLLSAVTYMNNRTSSDRVIASQLIDDDCFDDNNDSDGDDNGVDDDDGLIQ